MRRETIDRTRRRAAITATAIAVPIAVLLAFGLAYFTNNSGASSGSSPSPDATAAVTVEAPPTNPATVEPCAQVIDKMPVQLNGRNPRIVHVPQTAAWGNPPTVVRCGVSRPAALAANSTAQVTNVSGVEWLVDLQKTQAVYTVVDRSVYVEVDTNDTVDTIAPISAAILAALPQPVCYVDAPISAHPGLPECTRRQ